MVIRVYGAITVKAKCKSGLTVPRCVRRVNGAGDIGGHARYDGRGRRVNVRHHPEVLPSVATHRPPND